MARPSATSSVVHLDICSKPPTSTMSYMPEAMARHPFAEGQGAGGAGAFRAGDRFGHVPHEVGYDRGPVGLLHEKVIGEVADVDRIDVFGVDPLVHGTDHLRVGFGKKILAVAVFEKTQLGQPAADDRHVCGPAFVS